MKKQRLQSEANMAIRMIAMESAVFTNAISTLKSKFAPLISYLGNSFFVPAPVVPTDIELTKAQKAMCLKLDGSNYMKVAELPVHLMPGLCARFDVMRPVIDDAVANIKAFNNEVLNPYYVYLSAFVSNKEAKTSTKDNSFVYKKLEQKREAEAKETKKLFSQTETTGEIAFCDLVGRASDLQHVFDHANKTKKEFSQIDFKGIKENIEKCVEVLDAIVKDAASGDTTAVSAETLRTLAAGAYEMAKQAEYISALSTLVIGYTTAVDNTLIALEEANKAGTF